MRESALAQGRNLEFVLIDAERDGIRKITDTLAQKSDLDAIHIISHASDGAVQLGSAQLDFETLVKRAASVKKWGEALDRERATSCSTAAISPPPSRAIADGGGGAAHRRRRGRVART